MNTKNWTKKDKVACTIIFTICILTFVVFLSTMTLSFFYDEHSASDIITAGTVSISVTGGADGKGGIEFPEVLAPNTIYSTTDYPSLAYKVTNTSTSGSIYLMIKLSSENIYVIRPIMRVVTTNDKFVVGGDNAQYLFYMQPIAKNSTVQLTNSWQVGNFTNAIDGSQVTYKITAYAVQAQGGAVEALIAGQVDGWQYAPQVFRDMIARS